MNTKFFSIVLFFTFSVLLAQQKIYFDENWEVITDKSKAKYYRLTTEENGLYHLKDYYLNGVIQMDGFSKNNDPNDEIYEGKVSWYYEDGKLYQTANYKDGVLTGEFKSYDQMGRLLSNYTYDEKGLFSGQEFMYKRTSPTDSLGADYNYESFFKEGNTERTVVYDESKSGIRYESFYSKTGEKIKDVYYGSKGEKIGESTYENYAPKGTVVDYYYLPMRVRSIQTIKNINSYIPAEEKYFYKSGKILSVTKNSNKKGTTAYYDVAGNKLGELTYSIDDNDVKSNKKGTEIFFDDDTEKIKSKTTYQDDQVTHQETFNSNGSVKSIANYENFELSNTTNYDESSKEIAKMIYQDGLPYNGKYIDESSEIVYSNGKLMSQDMYQEKDLRDGTSKKVKIMQSKMSNGVMQGAVYDLLGNQIYDFAFPNFDESSTYISGTVKSYQNGKQKYTAEVENGNLKSGTLLVFKGNSTEIWKADNGWLVRDFFEDSQLTKSIKEKQYIEPDYSYDSFDRLISFQLLLQSLYYYNYE